MPTGVAPSTTELSFSIKNLQKLLPGGGFCFQQGPCHPAISLRKVPAASPLGPPAPSTRWSLWQAEGTSRTQI